MKNCDVKNKLNTSFLTLLAKMSPSDLSFKVLEHLMLFDNGLILLFQID